MCIQHYTVYAGCQHRIHTSTEPCEHARAEDCPNAKLEDSANANNIVTDDPGRCKSCRDKRRTTTTREQAYRSHGLASLNDESGSGLDHVAHQAVIYHGNDAALVEAGLSSQVGLVLNGDEQQVSHFGGGILGVRGGSGERAENGGDHNHENGSSGDCFICLLGLAKWF